MADPKVDLYWHPGTCSRISLMALEEIGTEFDLHLVHKSNREENARYTHDVNPKGKVPALVVDGRVITETPAIQIYLNGQFPEAGLLPSDPDGYLDAVILMSWFAAGIHPMINKSRFPMFSSAVPESFASIKEIALANLRDCFGQIEERLADRDWLLGDWTIADAYLLWLWFRGVGSGLTGDEFPLVDSLCRRCEERPSVARVLDREEKEYGEMERAGHVMPNAPPMVAGRLPKAA